MQPTPLEVLEIETLASGHRSLRLTRAVAWEEFAAYAESVVRTLNGRVLHKADSPVERVWSVKIDDGQYWLSLDDFGLGVSLDSCDAAADDQIEKIRSKLIAIDRSRRNDGRL